MNGMYMNTPNTRSAACSNAPTQFVARNPDITSGVVHGILTPEHIGTKFIAIAKYDITMFIVGTNMNGTNIAGFKTIGKPNNIGSFIPNIPGTNDILPRFFIRFDLQNNNIAITSDNVEPAPPNVANKSWNCWHII